VAFTTHHPRSSHIKVATTNHQHQDITDIQLEQVIQQKLQSITTGYETHINNMIQSLEVELELCIKTEKCLLRDISQLDNYNNSLLLSEKYRSKSNIMKQCFDTNYQVVQQLLLGPSSTDTSNLLQKIQFATTNPSTSDNSQDLMLGNGGVTNTKQKEIDGYDTTQQVIHHTSRDWTSGSKSCREATNGWIVNALVENISTTIISSSSSSSTAGRRELRVLVPGAGLGRLAYDIATSTILQDHCGVDVHVEANDSSVTMAFATQSVLEIISSQQQQYMIYPFISDPTRNEVDSKKRFEYEMFPDDDALDAYRRYYYRSSADNNNNNSIAKEDTKTNTLLPNLSYTVGDFISTYSQGIKQSQYDIIATSFFLDTATNIYEYIMIMKHLLKQQQSSTTSLWINCGPVQWHPCALLHPTVDELYDMLVVCGFELISWEVDNEAVAYRHPDDCGSVMEGEERAARYTRSEGYRPLRFVARLVNDGEDADAADDDLSLRIEYCEYLNGVANGRGV